MKKIQWRIPMPKLSKTRIINLNYNDGKRTIYNEIFDYGDGKDTLFSMENGVGKTVLIQFFMQPFIRNKRELQGRKFEDYFSSTPTYIMHEILLDNGEKLLAGMLIKKDNSDDEKNKLKIFTFLNKYSKPNDFDIINAPFVENKKILSFSECEEKIKKYKIGKLHFKYYNFNDSSKKSEYFEDLKSYRLDYKEWEDLIRNINNDESGLSNLYDKYKTDEALIRNVIIPLIESKINGEKNAIESIRNNLSKYIESYKQNKESFCEVELLKVFQSDMHPIIQQLKDGLLKEDTREKLYKRLSNIALLCEEELEKKFTEKLRHEELMEDLQNELIRVAYEEHSLSYYNLQAQAEKVEQRLAAVREDNNDREIKKQELLKEKYIQECAEIYEELLSIEGSLIKTRERIANYEREDSEVAQNIRNYKFTLKNLYELELKELQEKEMYILQSKLNFKKELGEKEQDIIENDRRQRENIKIVEAYKNKIKYFEKMELEFQKKYDDFKAIRNVLLNEYDEKELESYTLGIAEGININKTLEKNLNNELTSLIVEREDISKRIKSSNSILNEKNLKLAKRQNQLKLFNLETTKILQILTVKNLPLDPVSQKEILKEVIKNESNKLWDAFVKEQDKLREIEDIIHRYQTGLIKLPREVLHSFENKGIQFEYALKWLQNYKGSKEEKESLVKNNPFFPYGILLGDKEINLLKNESLDVYTSVPIPIINKNELAKGLALDKNNSILTIQNQEFLLSFNYLLIDEEERTELLRSLSLDIELLNSEISKIHNAIDRNKDYEKNLANYPYNGDEDGVIKADINSLEQDIKELEVLLEQYNNQVQNNENRKEAITKKIYEAKENQMFLEEKKDRFNKFILEHQEFKINNKELYNLQSLMKELEDIEKGLKEDNSKIRTALNQLEIESYKIKVNIQECSLKLELYKTVEIGTLLEEDRNSIEARLQACEKELDGNIKRDKEDEKRLSKELRKKRDKLDRKASEGKLSKEYLGTIFSVNLWEELKRQIDVLEDEIRSLNNQIHSLDKKVEVITTKKQRELEDIVKIGFNIPIAKESIGNPDFKTRRKKIEEDLRQNGDIIKDYLEQINRLNFLKSKLETYKSPISNLEAMNFNFKDLTAALNAVDKDLELYETIKKEIYATENKLSKEIRLIYEKYRGKNRFIQDRLNSYLSKERKISSHIDIESLLEVVNRKISTLELELKSIRMEEEVVINEILRYTAHVLTEFKTIDKKSNIKHLGKTHKLLEINIPEERNEENLKEYIKEKVNYYAKFEGDYLNHLDNDIQSAELLGKFIGNINRIRVDIKKIEKSGLVRKSWKEAITQNSGGEKFVSMFILLSSLMSYMRRRETDIDNKEENKILIMDNPFAKTNAEHLLEPMFQIAEKYNIQLLCFSGIGGSAVYNRFNKIYVAKLIEDRFRNKENISFKAGNEETLELSDFTITKQQISLF